MKNASFRVGNTKIFEINHKNNVLKGRFHCSLQVNRHRTLPVLADFLHTSYASR